MKFIFYYDYKYLIGGLTSLYITILEELLHQKCDFVFFNFKDGIVNKEFQKKGLNIQVIDIPTFDWKQLDKVISTDDILVTTSFSEALNQFMGQNPRVLYYTVHEFLAEISNYKYGINSKALSRKLVAKLDEKNSLLLMDDTGIRNSIDKLRYKIANPVFLPIPVKVPVERLYNMPVKLKNLKLSYIGRSVDWKMMPLKRILDDISTFLIKNNIKIVFSIAVDNIKNLERYIDIKQYNSDRFKVNVYESVAPSAINNFLLSNSDLGFGMGTAALDYAKLGIPVILVDYSKIEFPEDYRYEWLFNSQFFCLGKNITQNPSIINEGISMEALLKDCINTPDFLKIQSDATYNYVLQNHSVQSFVTNLLAYSKACSFKLRDAIPYILYFQKFHKFLKNILTLKFVR